MLVPRMDRMCASLHIVVCSRACILGCIKDAPRSCAHTEVLPLEGNYTASARTEHRGDASGHAARPAAECY